MEIKEVTRYAVDGEIFIFREEAENYIAVKSIVNEIYDNTSLILRDAEEVVAFLLKNYTLAEKT